MRKAVAVIGLGRFGISLATTLHDASYEVLAERFGDALVLDGEVVRTSPEDGDTGGAREAQADLWTWCKAQGWETAVALKRIEQEHGAPVPRLGVLTQEDAERVLERLQAVAAEEEGGG